MELKVHDLIQLHSPGELQSELPIPEWVHDSLNRAPWVVVRRSRIQNGLIPVGVRGSSRNQRFAAQLPVLGVKELVSPEKLTDSAWHKHRYQENAELYLQVDRIAEYYNQVGLRWGLAGGVGFELASGVRTVHPNSDIDLVLYTPDQVDRITAASWHAFSSRLSVRVDALLETPMGACSLQEYVRSAAPLLLRTENGPLLVKSPWTID